jgi:hypothetical protein
MVGLIFTYFKGLSYIKLPNPIYQVLTHSIIHKLYIHYIIESVYC